MPRTIKLGDIPIDVVKKDIKNVHLSVYPPTGRVRISAPQKMRNETIRVFAVSKLAWIKRQQKKLQQQERETPRSFVDRESHQVWGERYLLKVQEVEAPPRVELRPKSLVLQVRPGTELEKRAAVLDGWYREELRAKIPLLVATWEPRMSVEVSRFFIQRMRTKWGSCNTQRSSIRLNLELAKKPVECLEYVVVHEMAHLLEPTHNERFLSLMDKFMPLWRFYRDLLNQAPLRSEDRK